jgi:hypothetical protein
MFQNTIPQTVLNLYALFIAMELPTPTPPLTPTRIQRANFIVDAPNQSLYHEDLILVAKRPRVALLPK